MAGVIPNAELQYQLAHINQSSSSHMIAVNIALPILSTIVVLLRLYSRRLKRTPWKADDFVVVSALVKSPSEPLPPLAIAC